MQQIQQVLQTTANEERIRGYLDALERPVVALGEEARADWRREAESHIGSLVAAFEELGDSHEDAVRQALARFGDTRTITRGIEREVRRSTAHCTRFPLALAAGALTLAIAPFVAYAMVYTNGGNPVAESVLRVVPQAASLTVPFLFAWSIGAAGALDGIPCHITAFDRTAAARLVIPIALLFIISEFCALEWTVIRQMYDPAGYVPGSDWMLPLACSVVAVMLGVGRRHPSPAKAARG